MTMTNRDAIERMYEAFAARDDDAFKALCAPDMHWIQNAGFPGGGHHIGPDAVIEKVFKGFGRDWETFRFEREEMFEADGAIVVLGAYAGRHRATGKAFRAACAHIYEVKGGLITRYRQFADTKLIADATV